MATIYKTFNLDIISESCKGLKYNVALLTNRLCNGGKLAKILDIDISQNFAFQTKPVTLAHTNLEGKQLPAPTNSHDSNKLTSTYSAQGPGTYSRLKCGTRAASKRKGSKRESFQLLGAIHGFFQKHYSN